MWIIILSLTCIAAIGGYAGYVIIRKRPYYKFASVEVYFGDQEVNEKNNLAVHLGINAANTICTKHFGFGATTKGDNFKLRLKPPLYKKSYVAWGDQTYQAHTDIVAKTAYVGVQELPEQTARLICHEFAHLILYKMIGDPIAKHGDVPGWASFWADIDSPVHGL